MSIRPAYRPTALALQPLEPREVPAVAALQLINNSPAARMAEVDVYANNVRVADNLSYREATAYVNVTAGRSVKVDVTDARAADNSRPLATRTVRLTAGQSFVGVLSGDPAAVKSSDRVGLALAAGRAKAADPTKADVLVFNGVVGAGAVDLKVEGGATIGNDIRPRQFAAAGRYQSVRPGDFDLQLTSADGSTTLAEFDADMAGAGGQAMVLVATGAAGGDGPDLMAVRPDGGVTMLEATAAFTAQSATVLGTDGSDFFVVTSQVPGVTQVINAYTGEIVEFDNATTPTVTIDAGGGNNGLVVVAPAEGELAAVEFVGGAGVDVVYLAADDRDDTVTATQTGDRLDLAAGFVTLGAVGVDQLNVFTQGGDDRVDLSGVNLLTVIAGGDGDDTLTGGTGTDLILGDDGDDVVAGGAGADTLFGGNGDDRVDGGDGDDLAFGDPGTDTLVGGAGDDWLIDLDDDTTFIDP